MFTLYASLGAGSVAVEALLAEIGAPYQVVDLKREADGLFPKSFLAINPRGEVPSLRLSDDSVMTESAAMMIYLADLFPAAGLAPAATSSQRPRYLRWLLYFASAVYPADLRYFYGDRYTADPAGGAAVKAQAVKDMARDFDIFAADLGAGPFILGDTFSAADIYAAMLLSWSPDLEALFARHPALRTYYATVAERPRIAPVWTRNEMP
jgi:glutathione S-transferase